MEFSLLCSHPTLWRPEYGSYMIEGTPGQPYGGTMSEFNTVEDNMRKRRKEATALLGENQALCTITSFPRLVPVWTCPSRSFRALGSKRANHDPSIWPSSSHTSQTVRTLCAAFDGLCHIRATGRPCVPASAGGWWARALLYESIRLASVDRTIRTTVTARVMATPIPGWGGGRGTSAKQFWPCEEEQNLMAIRCSPHLTLTVASAG